MGSETMERRWKFSNSSRESPYVSTKPSSLVEHHQQLYPSGTPWALSARLISSSRALSMSFRTRSRLSRDATPTKLSAKLAATTGMMKTNRTHRKRHTTRLVTELLDLAGKTLGIFLTLLPVLVF